MPRPDSERRSKWPAVVLAVLLLVPVLYVASAGPAAAWVVREKLAITTYYAVYAPVLTAEERWLPVSNAMAKWRKRFLSEDDETKWYVLIWTRGA